MLHVKVTNARTPATFFRAAVVDEKIQIRYAGCIWMHLVKSYEMSKRHGPAQGLFVPSFEDGKLNLESHGFDEVEIACEELAPGKRVRYFRLPLKLWDGPIRDASRRWWGGICGRN